MPSWPAKDPGSILDYDFRVPLDAGDSVSGQPTAEVIDGSIVIDSQEPIAAPNTITLADGTSSYGQDLKLWISGGTDGEIGIIRISWTTAGGRTPDPAIITLPVIETDLEPLLLTGYMKPLPGHFTARYPAFASVAEGAIAYWLTDAERSVDTSWGEGDYAAALMSLAAHNMALAGLGTDGALVAVVPGGVSRFKSGSLDVTLTDAAANARMGGDFTATRYGQEYQALLRRNRGGPRVSDTGAWPACDYYPYPAGYGYPY